MIDRRQQQVAVDDTITDQEIEAAATPPMVKAAGLIWGIEGFLVLASGAQLFVFGTGRVVPLISALGLLLLGVGSIVCAHMVYHLKNRSLLIALPFAFVLATLLSAWLLFSFRAGFYSLMVFIAAPGSIAPLVLTILAAKRAKSVLAMRSRLRERGLDLGL
jgi:hypothetical protein